MDMMNQALISVVLPTYNRGELLLRAVHSVLEQTWRNLELIVVDDASTDNTAALLATVEDSRLRYIRQETNHGACAARNVGVRAAQGAYIAFQDSDDVWLPEKLERQMAFLQTSGADVVFCAFRRFADETDAGEVFPAETIAPGRIHYEQLLMENLISTQTLLGKHACFLAHPFDESFPRMQDWELVLRLSQHVTIHYDNQVLVSVYLQGDSISRKPEAGLAALNKLYAMHREAIEANDALYRRFIVAIATMTVRCGRNPWRNYFHALSPRMHLSTNVYLLAHGLRALVTGR